MCLQDTCEMRQGKGGKEELFLGLLFCEFSASEKCWIDSSGDGSAPRTAGKGQPSTSPSSGGMLSLDLTCLESKTMGNVHSVSQSWGAGGI